MVSPSRRPLLPQTSSYFLPTPKLSKAPQHNPYDKFSQHEFDAWIGGITGELRKALGQDDVVVSQEKDGFHEEDQYASDEEEVERLVQLDSESSDEVEDETFSYSPERRVSKGKARDPRDGPGFGKGDQNEPIVIDSDSEEEEEEQEEEEEEEEQEQEQGWGGGSQSEDEDERESPSVEAESSLQARIRHEMQSADGVLEDEEEVEYEEGDEQLEFYEEGHGAQSRGSSPILVVASDEEEALDEEGSVQLSDEDTTIPLQTVYTRIGPPRHRARYRTEVSVEENEEGESVSYDAEEVEVEAQPIDDDTSFPPHEESPPEKPVVIRDIWYGPETYAEDYYSGGDVVRKSGQVTADSLGENDTMPAQDQRSEEPSLEEESLSDKMIDGRRNATAEDRNDSQPLSEDTSFPPRLETPNHLASTNEISDLWEGVTTYAEDYYSGGDVRPSSNNTLDPHRIGENDASVPPTPSHSSEVSALSQEMPAISEIQPSVELPEESEIQVIDHYPGLNFSTSDSRRWHEPISDERDYFGGDHEAYPWTESAPKLSSGDASTLTPVIDSENEVELVEMADEAEKEGQLLQEPPKSDDRVSEPSGSTFVSQPAIAQLNSFDFLYEGMETENLELPRAESKNGHQPDEVDSTTLPLPNDKLSTENFADDDLSILDVSPVHSVQTGPHEETSPTTKYHVDHGFNIQFPEEPSYPTASSVDVENPTAQNASPVLQVEETPSFAASPPPEPVQNASSAEESHEPVEVVANADGSRAKEAVDVCDAQFDPTISESFPDVSGAQTCLPSSDAENIESLELAEPDANSQEVSSTTENQDTEGHNLDGKEVETQIFLEDFTQDTVMEFNDLSDESAVNLVPPPEEDLTLVPTNPSVPASVDVSQPTPHDLVVDAPVTADAAKGLENIIHDAEPVLNAEPDFQEIRSMTLPESPIQNRVESTAQGLTMFSGVPAEGLLVEDQGPSAILALTSQETSASVDLDSMSPIEPASRSQTLLQNHVDPTAESLTISSSVPSPDLSVQASLAMPTLTSQETAASVDLDGDLPTEPATQSQVPEESSNVAVQPEEYSSPALPAQQNGPSTPNHGTYPPYSSPWNPYPMQVVMRKTTDPMLYADPYPASLSTPDDGFAHEDLDYDETVTFADDNSFSSSHSSSSLPKDSTRNGAMVGESYKPTPEILLPSSGEQVTTPSKIGTLHSDLAEADADGDLDPDYLHLGNTAQATAPVLATPPNLPPDSNIAPNGHPASVPMLSKTIEKDHDQLLSSPLSSPPAAERTLSESATAVRSPEEQLPTILIIKKAAGDERPSAKPKVGRPSKRKRSPSNTSTPPLPKSKKTDKGKVASRSIKSRGSDTKITTKIDKKGKSKEVIASPLSQGSFDARSVSSASSSDASAARRILNPSSRGTSRASSIASTAPSEDPFHGAGPPSQLGPLLHRHHHNRPGLQQPSRSTAAQKPSLSFRQNDPVATETPASKHSSSSHRHITLSTSSPVTRSNCRYHKISIPLDEDDEDDEDEVKLVYFLVPGCSLGNMELNRDEKIVDCGDATPADAALMTSDLDAYAFNAPLLSVLRLLVGVDMLREGEIYYVPQPGSNWVRRKVRDIPNKVPHSPVGTPPFYVSPRRMSSMSTMSWPVASSSTSTNGSGLVSAPIRSLKPSSAISQSSSDLTDVEDSPQSKRIRTSSVDGKMANARRAVAESSLPVKRIDQSEADDKSGTGDDDEDSKRLRLGTKQALKRSRTADIAQEAEDSQTLKKQKTEPQAT
ncbi:hypothetical protein H0H92_010225 [Tricholoma furcatifolium]|nr:hypothetical protein H0H92_010225 [Tricholoma furcatifolium]